MSALPHVQHAIYLLEERDAKNPVWRLNHDMDAYTTVRAAEAGRTEWLGLNAELIDTEGREYDGHLDGYEVRVVEYRRMREW